VPVARLNADEFMVVAPTADETRVCSWLQRQLEPHESAVATNVTSGYGVIGVMGPAAREVLGQVSDIGMPDHGPALNEARRVSVASAPCIVLCVGYTGEIGYEIFAPAEFAQTVYAAVLAAGPGYGMRHVGYHALDSLRVEAGDPHWGHEMSNADLPDEVGLRARVAEDKGSFVGRDAVLRARERPTGRRPAFVRLREGAPLLLHGEPLYRDGQVVGSITSGVYSFTFGCQMGLATMDATADQDLRGAYEVEIAAERYPVDVSSRPFYPPQEARARLARLAPAGLDDKG
jgi:glycine cleavage system aminomethyltransferase T